MSIKEMSAADVGIGAGGTIILAITNLAGAKSENRCCTTNNNLGLFLHEKQPEGDPPYIVSPGTDALVGRFFHTFDDEGYVDKQGHVAAKVESGKYLVQLYSWIMGEETTMHVVDLEVMTTNVLGRTGFQFYTSEDQWRFWYENKARKRA